MIETDVRVNQRRHFQEVIDLVERKNTTNINISYMLWV